MIRFKASVSRALEGEVNFGNRTRGVEREANSVSLWRIGAQIRHQFCINEWMAKRPGPERLFLFVGGRLVQIYNLRGAFCRGVEHTDLGV